MEQPENIFDDDVEILDVQFEGRGYIAEPPRVLRQSQALGGVNLPEKEDIQFHLDLFGVESSNYSQTIDLYDAIPKYTIQDRRSSDLSSAETVRTFRHRQSDFIATIRPAIIRNEQGQNELIYPGVREELVESVLRKFATEGHAVNIMGNAGVQFTLYRLRDELRRLKHSYSLTEIKEALMVCRGSTLDVSTANGETVISSSFFPVVALTKRSEWLANPSGSFCAVVFNPLVTRSIQSLSFRIYNYQANMSMSSPLARFLHKKMSHNYKQASLDMPYTIMLVSFLSGSDRGMSPRMPENVRAMKNALDHLIKHRIVLHYDTDRIMRGKAITDIKYVIFPHEDFIRDVKAANHIQRSNNLKLTRLSLQK